MLNFKKFNLNESVKFKKKPKKKGAKTDVYDVINDDILVGQVKLSSRVMGYAFTPTKDCESEVKEFVKSLMDKRRLEKKKSKKK